MIKIFKDAFKVSYNNIIIATPLLLFMLILNVYLIVSKDAVKALPSAILFFLTLFLMVSAFLAGWFYMVKVAVEHYKNSGIDAVKDSETSFSLMREFPVGIAEHIKSFLGFTVLYFIVADFEFFSLYYIGLKLIGGIGISLSQFVSATEAPVAMQAFIQSLTKAQLLKINYWYLLIVCSAQIFALLTMFWPIELMYFTKNPVLAFFKSVSRIFTHPKSILLFIFINLLNCVLMLFNYVAMFNPIAYFVMTLVFFYFIVYVFVLLFLYYEEKIKSNSDSSADGDGQE